MSTKQTDSATKTSSSSLNRRIGLYSLAAAVAGVSMVALVEPAAGEIVVTHKAIPIPLSPQNNPDPVHISLANNGVENFTFVLRDNLSYRDLWVTGIGREDGVIDGGTWSASAMALPAGKRIGPKNSAFSSGYARVESSISYPDVRAFRGYWGGSPKDKYLGVRFETNGKFHYGWIRLSVTTSKQLHGPVMSAVITEYAYETVPNQAINAGQTQTAEVQVPENMRNQSGPSLGMLAAGSEGLPLWRREETSPSQ